MIGLSNLAKDGMLSIFADKYFELALFTGQEEISDALYRRQNVLFSFPVEDGNVRYVENVEKVLFEGFNNKHTVDHWGIFNQNGEIYALYRVIEPIDVSPTMDCKFRPGELRIGLP